MHRAILLIVAARLVEAAPTLAPSIEVNVAPDGAPWTVMTVRIETDLPDRAILSVFLYDETDGRAVLLDQGRCETRDGASSIALARTKGPPLSGVYRAEVVFEPARQRDAVLEAMRPPPTGETRGTARIEVGAKGDRERDIARERERLRADLDALSTLVDELSARLSKAREEGFDRGSYAAWQAEWKGRLDARESENRDRPYVKVLHVSGVGQARHQGLVQIAREASEAPLSDRAPESLLAAALGGVEKFRVRLGKVREEAGIVDAASVPRFDPAPFRTLAQELTSRWKEGAPEATWLADWRARWARALAAALPALAPLGDQAATRLAVAGARLFAAQDAVEALGGTDRLEALLAELAAR